MGALGHAMTKARSLSLLELVLRECVLQQNRVTCNPLKEDKKTKEQRQGEGREVWQEKVCEEEGE